MTGIQFNYTKSPKCSEIIVSEHHFFFTNAEVEKKWLMIKEENSITNCRANHSYRSEKFRDFL
jgi:hypothetical protein